MKKMLVFSICISCCVGKGFSQDNTTSKVPEEIVMSGIYRFQDFVQGVVYHNNGSQSNARLNFNLLLQEIHFIDPRGDTLAISSPNTISAFVLDQTIYIYAKEGYLEVLADYASIQLAGKFRLLRQTEKIGAYGQSSPGSAIETYTSIWIRNYEFKLTPNVDMKMLRGASYFFLVNNRHPVRASKSNLIKLMPSQKEKIEVYLQKYKINFNNETELRQLLSAVTGHN